MLIIKKIANFRKCSWIYNVYGFKKVNKSYRIFMYTKIIQDFIILVIF